MNKRLSFILTRFSLLLGFACFAPITSALSTDKDQNIEIESNSAMLDDIKNISIYTGNVTVDQGSMRITGNKMTVYYHENNDLERIVVEGQPAKFRQLPDNNSVYDEAESLVIEFHQFVNLIILIDKAFVNQAGTLLTGDRIEYDTVASRIKADRTQATKKTGQGAGSEKQDNRVKLIIPKKKTDNPGTATDK